MPDTVDGFRSAAAALATPREEPPWVILSGRRNGHDVDAVAQMPPRSVRRPRFDTHVAITLPFEGRGNGDPTDAALNLQRTWSWTVTHDPTLKAIRHRQASR